MKNRDANGVRPDNSGARVTILTHGSFIGKRFDAVEGELVKTSKATFYNGTAQSVAAPDAVTLADILDSLKPDRDVLNLGRMKGDLTSAQVVTGAKLDPARNVIARSLAHFEHASGEGWLLLDHDTKDMPDDVRARVEALGGGVAAIKCIWPDLADADYLVRPSSSGGVYIDGGSPTAATGFHLFVRVDDVRKSKKILDTLTARAWSAGLAWHAVSTVGSLLERSVIDAAVGGPERLVFTAAPVLGEGVRRRAPESVIQCGMAISAPTMPETGLFAPQRRDSRQKLKPEAERTEADYTADQVDKLTAKGIARSAAERIVRDRVRGGVLADDDALQMSDGSHSRVGDILDASFTAAGADKLSLPDPVEGVEYGKTTGAIIWGVGHDAPVLISHAHGKVTTYRFARYMNDDDIEAQQARGDHDRAVETGDLPEAVDLPDGRRETLIEALKAAQSRDDALAIAQAVLSRWIKRTPHSMSADALVCFITDHLTEDLLTEADIAGLRKKIDRRNYMRKKAALGFVGLSPQELHSNTNVMTVDTLDSAGASPHGVTIVKAPMGKGKTQKMAAPWIKAARKRGSSMAICHRVSLVDELARRLNLPHYKHTTIDDIIEANGIAVCLPSITSKIVGETITTPDFVAIDEVAQVLRFLASKDVCRTKHANAQVVFDTLVKIIRSAKGVLVLDADVNDRVMQFLRYCRPDETLNVVLMKPTPHKKSAKVYASNNPAGSAVRAQVLADLSVELAAGGKCYLACESAKLACDFDTVLTSQGHKVLCVTAANKDGNAQAAFLANADAQSRFYDAVIVSPAVVSGISIEHHDRPHFTLGAFIGGGQAIVPSDAAQQMVRVRYLDRYVVGLVGNNAAGMQTKDAILQGQIDLADIENAPVNLGFDDCMRANIKATEENAKADFAAGLFWMLERDGWSLEPVDVDATAAAKKELKAAKDARVDARNTAIMAAEILDQDTADFLRGRQLTEAEAAQLEAFDIAETLKISAVDLEAIGTWDDGRFKSKLRRFNALFACDEPALNDGSSVIDRRFRRAEHSILKTLLGDIDLHAEHPFTPEKQEIFVDRVMQYRLAMVELGLLPSKYRAYKFSRPKQIKRVFSDVLGRLGLAVSETRIRLSQNTPSLYKDIQSEGVLGQQDNRVRVYGICPQSLALMDEIKARHNPAVEEQLGPLAMFEVVEAPDPSLKAVNECMASLNVGKDAEVSDTVKSIPPDPEPVLRPGRRLVLIPKTEQVDSPLMAQFIEARQQVRAWWRNIDKGRSISAMEFA